MNNIFSLLDLRTLAIKVFRLILIDPDFFEDGDASNEDIPVSDTVSNTVHHSFQHALSGYMG
jgi:hypothetical protein